MRGRWLVTGAVIIAAMGMAPAMARAGDDVVAERIDAGHTGFASGGSLDRPPLRTRWSRALGTSMSSPLIVGSRAYVVHKDAAHASATLSALDLTTGATEWSRPVGTGSDLAYDEGRVYALAEDGQMVTVDATTGAILWTRVIREPFDGTAPVAADGRVYVFLAWSGGALYALDGATGETRWTNSALWDGGTPAIAGGFVYVHDDYDCATAAIRRDGGATAWKSSFDCWLGGTRAATDGAEVVTGAGQILDAGTGRLRDGSYGGAPSMAGTTRVQLNGRTLQARDTRTGLTLWEFTGDGKLAGSPLVVNHTVYVPSSTGVLHAVDLDSGRSVWSTTLGTACPTYDSYCTGLGGGTMAAGRGVLLVTNGGTLVALEDANPLPTPGLDLEILSGPEGPTGTTSPTFTFAATGTLVAECRLDRAGWMPCSGSASYDDLADGAHTFEVRTLGADGTPLALDARGFSVVSGPPRSTITGGPSGDTTARTASFEVGATKATSTQCRLDSGTWSTCSGTVTYSYLSDGAHVFQVRASNSLGEVEDPPSERRWTVDATPPETTIGERPSSGTARSARFTFSSADSSARFECQLDGAAWAGCTSPATYDDLAAGAHEFKVRAIDRIGNVDATPASASWTVYAAPETTISSGPPERSRQSWAEFAFSGGEGTSSFQCRLDGGTWTTCTSPRTVTGLADGDHVFEVRAVGTSGYSDATPARWAWKVDATAPQTTIVSAGADGPGGARFEFEASEPGTFTCSMDGSSWVECSSPVSYAGLAPGEHEFAVRATDVAQNTDATPAAARVTVVAVSTAPPPAPPTPPGTGTETTETGTETTETGTETTDAAGAVVREAPAPAPSPAGVLETPAQRSAATPRTALPASASEFADSVMAVLSSIRPRALARQSEMLVGFSAPTAGVLRAELRFGKGRRAVTVGRASARFRAGQARFVRVRLTRAGRARLRRAGRKNLRVLVTFTPAAGAAARGGGTVTLGAAG